MLTVLILSATLGSGISAELAAGKPESKPMAFVFETDRSGKHDLMLLKDGQKLSGKALNEYFTIRTPYARVKLDRRILAGIDLARSLTGPVSVLTVNSNQLTGLIEESLLVFQPEGGSRKEVRPETVAQLIFAVRDDELAGVPQRRWIRLRNGDLVSGEIGTDPLLIVTTDGQTQVPLKNLAALECTTNKSALRLHLRSGETLRGSTIDDDVQLKLDIGLDLAVYRGSIDFIADELTGLAKQPLLAAGTSTNLNGLVWIPPGEFTMGSPYDEPGRDRDEAPQTKVVIPKGFWMGKYEVTQAEYESVMGTNPSNNTDNPAQPVEKLSWFEAMEYCAKLTRLSEMSGQLPKGYAYRLPTEAEWEYACRAGTTTRFSYGDDRSDSKLADYAWFTINSDSTTHPVGKKMPNPWGLYDMHGNVWEWCLDRWETTLPGGSITNTPAAMDGILRVARGGSWLYEAGACRSANRDDYSPANRCGDLGFRVVLAPTP